MSSDGGLGFEEWFVFVFVFAVLSGPRFVAWSGRIDLAEKALAGRRWFWRGAGLGFLAGVGFAFFMMNYGPPLRGPAADLAEEKLGKLVWSFVFSGAALGYVFGASRGKSAASLDARQSADLDAGHEDAELDYLRRQVAERETRLRPPGRGRYGEFDELD